MIPTIETIVEDLAAGRITKSQAVTWLHQHAESAGRDLRDDFAAAALQGMVNEYNLSREIRPGYEERQLLVERCYQLADLMLAEREKAQS